jgi:hypothetical protein
MVSHNYLPPPNQEALPQYLQITTKEALDRPTDMICNSITSFTILADQDLRYPKNETTVIAAQDVGEFREINGRLGPTELAVIALTAVGMDKKQVLDAYGIQSGSEHPLEYAYAQLDIHDLSHDDPSTWSHAFALTNRAYNSELLVIKDPLVLPSYSSMEPAKLQYGINQVMDSIDVGAIEETVPQMRAITSQYGMPGLAALALGRTTSWRYVRPEDNAPSEDWVTHPARPAVFAEYVRKQGIPHTAEVYGATVSLDFKDTSLDPLEVETMKMAGFGLITPQMARVHPTFAEQEVSAATVFDRSTKKLGFGKSNAVKVVTDLVRSGYMNITPDTKDPAQLPDSHIHKAIIALIPSGMSYTQMANILSATFPEHRGIDGPTVKKYQREIYHAAEVSGIRELNLYLLAKGLTYKDDLFDVYTTDAVRNIARLRRKAGVTDQTADSHA